ncbi:hypothetical protein Tco_0951681 [Tanacetum coccineum]|uniref:Uncharacterized protein n=1 Tax=Tanacetum coccineum TaxID=301880 RepID=A0ABQ5DUV2_9ASTR
MINIEVPNDSVDKSSWESSAWKRHRIADVEKNFGLKPLLLGFSIPPTTECHTKHVTAAMSSLWCRYCVHISESHLRSLMILSIHPYFLCFFLKCRTAGQLRLAHKRDTNAASIGDNSRQTGKIAPQLNQFWNGRSCMDSGTDSISGCSWFELAKLYTPIREWMSSAQIHYAMLNIPQSTHDLINPFTVEDNDEVGRRSTITRFFEQDR